LDGWKPSVPDTSPGYQLRNGYFRATKIKAFICSFEYKTDVITDVQSVLVVEHTRGCCPLHIKILFETVIG
jgi:hypothetical protein